VESISLEELEAFKKGVEEKPKNKKLKKEEDFIKKDLSETGSFSIITKKTKEERKKSKKRDWKKDIEVKDDKKKIKKEEKIEIKQPEKEEKIEVEKPEEEIEGVSVVAIKEDKKKNKKEKKEKVEVEKPEEETEGFSVLTSKEDKKKNKKVEVEKPEEETEEFSVLTSKDDKKKNKKEKKEKVEVEKPEEEIEGVSVVAIKEDKKKNKKEDKEKIEVKEMEEKTEQPKKEEVNSEGDYSFGVVSAKANTKKKKTKSIKKAGKNITKLKSKDVINLFFDVDAIDFVVKRKGRRINSGTFFYEHAYSNTKEACENENLTKNLLDFKNKYKIRRQKINILAKDEVYVIRIVPTTPKTTRKEIEVVLESPFEKYEFEYFIKDDKAICIIINGAYLDHIAEIKKSTKLNFNLIGLRAIIAGNSLVKIGTSTYKLLVFINKENIIYNLYKEGLIIFSVYRDIGSIMKKGLLEKEIYNMITYVQNNQIVEPGEKQKLRTAIYSEKSKVFEYAFYENERIDIHYNVVVDDEQNSAISHLLERF